MTKQQIHEDLEYLTKILNETSSYVYLNGYDFNVDFEEYRNALGDSTPLADFSSFLTKVTGKIGDRHFTVNGFDNESLFLPFMYAPVNNKVVVLRSERDKAFEILHPKFPYLSKIDGYPIEGFLERIRPEDIGAPKDAYFKLAVRDIRDIQKNFQLLNMPLSGTIALTLSDKGFQNDTVVEVTPVERSKRARPWDEKFEVKYSKAYVRDEDFNKPEILDDLFIINDNIAYMKIPSMVSMEEAPLLFNELNAFMESLKHKSNALIIDVRSNGGGTRDITYEMAKYLVHPDSLYVVNVAKQRAAIPLTKDQKEALHGRFLYSYMELDNREQEYVSRFLQIFEPMYDLDSAKYSDYHFGLFNGEKMSAQPRSYHFNRPVYILANEKSFSAASVFVSVFKGLPNIKIVGVTTDGSSGNSNRYELPHSKFRGKISTMVSFQKDGSILDGFGTEPDIRIERDLDQILWKSDTQLEKLKSMITDLD